MKISEDIIQQLQAVLADYIAEAGVNEGKYLFSRDLGELENRLYTEAKASPFGFDFSAFPPDAFSDEIAGELDAVEDLPILEAVG